MEPFADKLTIVGAGAVVGAVVGAVAGPAGALAGAAIGGTAAHYLNKQQEEQSQQLTRREESRQSVINSPSSQFQTFGDQENIKQFLVLVISATQAEFLESLRAKRRIDMSDGERLYEITKYLWLGSKNDFNQGEASINQYSVSEGEESEYDIYLVYFKLKQPDEGFKPNINQLDRYDAFRKLDYLGIDFEISHRLQMEAYGNFEVYNR
jgi:hypothetical protein